MNKTVRNTGAVVVGAAILAIGAIGGSWFTKSQVVSAVQARNISAASTIKTPPASQKAVASNASYDIQQGGDTWVGLKQANTAWISTLMKDAVSTSDGKSAVLPKTGAIIFVAPWCKYCHETIQLLNQNHLLGSVKVANVSLLHQESSTDLTISNIGQAVSVSEASLQKLGVTIPANQMLYSMPGNALDTAIHGYPTVIIEHNGKWYVENGYVSSAAFWKTILG